MSKVLISAAILSLTGCLAHTQTHPEADRHNQLCVNEVNAGNLEEARIHCLHAIEFSPEYADAWVNLGLIAYKRGQRDEAKSDFIKAIHFDNECAQGWNDLGVLALEDGHANEAQQRFERALKVNPDYLEARKNLGLAHW